MSLATARAARILPVLTLAAWSLAGSACAAPTVLTAPAELQTTRAAEAGPAPAARPRTLAWTAGWAGRAPVTYVLDDDGVVRTELPGIRIAAADTEWTWQEVVVPIRTSPCDGITQDAPGEGHGTAVRLVPPDATREALVIVRPPTPEGENEIRHDARLLASVGPYLFIEESTYTYTCGAHGTSAVRFRVWNVDERRTLDLLSELPQRERLIAKAKTVLDDELAGPPDGEGNRKDRPGGMRPGGTGEGPDGELARDEDPPTITELLPKIGAHGRLEASVLVTIPSCFACTSGGWSSYTSSTPVASDLPERIRRLGPVPAALQRFADRHPALSIGGYSVNPGR
ncbi:MAG: hypothetical protein JOZ69_12635 [Myxococcales bacterium]|nr:hypothetical protein [Myxococcales bacterium]